jgi:hypothetical protein
LEAGKLEIAASVAPGVRESDTHHSSFREKLLEHVFISELLQEAWLKQGRKIEVLRSEVDDCGYDLVLMSGPVTRLVQLKSSRSSSTTSEQTVSLRLCERAGGCVLWLIFDEDQETGRLQLNYRFFGPGPGETLVLDEAFKTAKHVKANAQGVFLERPKHRVVTKKHFRPVPGGVSELITLLFG